MGLWLMSGSPMLSELGAHAGFDWALIDTQHGYWGYSETVAAIHEADTPTSGSQNQLVHRGRGSGGVHPVDLYEDLFPEPDVERVRRREEVLEHLADVRCFPIHDGHVPHGSGLEPASASFLGPVISAMYFFHASALPDLTGLVNAYEAMIVLLSLVEVATAPTLLP